MSLSHKSQFTLAPHLKTYSPAVCYYTSLFIQSTTSYLSIFRNAFLNCPTVTSCPAMTSSSLKVGSFVLIRFLICCSSEMRKTAARSFQFGKPFRYTSSRLHISFVNCKLKRCRISSSRKKEQH